jgi:Rrf2 family nitric oxide-sensitive transcriptional repressor
MRLTVFSDYALRTLIYLAVHGRERATIADIAAAYSISEAHLTKIVHALGRSGEIETARGRGGGLRLARPPARINLGALVRRTEADLVLVPCFDAPERCAIGGACGLHDVLREALEAFLAVLDRYTLADLIGPRHALATLLRIEPMETA